MRRALALATLLSAVAALPAQAASPACSRLRGEDLAPAASVRLFVREAARGVVRIEACGLGGRVRELARGSRFENGAETPRIRAVSGAYAVLTTTFADQYGDAEATQLVNLRTGAKRSLARFEHQGGEAPTEDIGEKAVTVLPTAGGRVAVALLEPATQTVRIVAYARGGREITLDRAPAAALDPASLTLDGETLTWTNAGAPRTAPLPQR